MGEKGKKDGLLRSKGPSRQAEPKGMNAQSGSQATGLPVPDLLCQVAVRWSFLSITDSPVEGHSSHGVDAGEDGSNGKEVVELAVEEPVVPLIVDRVGEVHHCIESSHGGLGKGQVHQEIIGHCPHSLVGQDDPHHHHVAHHGGHHDDRVGNCPKDNLPGRLHELVGLRSVGGDVGEEV